MKLFIQEWIVVQNMSAVHITVFEINTVVPIEAVGDDGARGYVFHGGRSMMNKNIVQSNETISAGDPISVCRKSVIEQENFLRNTGTLKILPAMTATHAPQSSRLVFMNQISFNNKDSVRQPIIIDKLNAIFAVTVDVIVANDTAQYRTVVGLKTDLDTVVLVVANNVILDDDVHLVVQVDPIIAKIGRASCRERE